MFDRLPTRRTSLFALLWLAGNVFAQPPETPGIDRPTQRWLPLPENEQIDLKQQSQLLQELRDLVSHNPSDPISKLSEQQLRQMEQTLKDLRKQVGEDNLPNLESIPKEWVDKAISDPVLRKQTQQMLEQYARERKLPSPERRKAASPEAVPLPRRGNSVQSTPQPEGSGQGQFAADPPDKKQSAAPDKSLDDQPSDAADQPTSTTHTAPDAERIQALQQLFEKLKSINQPNAKNLNSKNSPDQSLNSSETRRQPNKAVDPIGPVRKYPNSGALEPRSAAPQNQLHPRNDKPLQTPRTTPNSQFPNSNNAQPNTNPRVNQGQSPSESEPTQESPASLSNAGNDPSGNQLPGNQLPGNPFGQSANGPSTNGSSVPNNTQPTTKPIPSRPTTGVPSANDEAGHQKSREAPPVAPEERKSSWSSDAKQQLERHGFGRALREIVEKTLKEQGVTDSPQQRPRQDKVARKNASQSQPKASDSSQWNKPKPQLNSVTKSALPRASSSSPSTQSPSTQSPSTQSPSTQSPSTQSPSSPNTFDTQVAKNGASPLTNIRDIASDVWTAFRSTDGSSSKSSTASASQNSNQNSGSPKPMSTIEFNWGEKIWLLILISAMGLVLIFLFARKQIQQVAAARFAESSAANEVFAEGIRTRADVVRAFHRFVLRRTQPVANWWTHRYIAMKLTETSPQLETFIHEFSSVYEQARYLPPEIELSSAQLESVRSALKQCAVSGV